MNDKKLIDGSYYEEQYSDIDSEYFKLYVYQGIPVPAVEINQYLVDYAIMFFSLKPGSRVLDVGCGIGHSMRPFIVRGFRCHGIEVSSSARRYSPYREHITVGNITDMRCWENDRFDLAFSHGTMEHIDESLVDTTISELRRVATRQFHIISVDEESKKNDPGHITIRPGEWWMKKFGQNPEKYYMTGMIYDTLMNETREPIIFGVPAALSTHPIRTFFKNHAANTST